MKKYNALLIFGSLFYSVSAHAQSAEKSVPVVFKTAPSPLTKVPVIDLDGKSISRETLDFIKPDDIQSFNVEKDTASGRVYVKLKKGLNYHFLSMKEISDKFIKRELQNPLFFVNDQLVTTDSFLLADHLIQGIQVSLAESPVYQKIQKFDVVRIRTTVAPQQFIRGTAGAK